MRNLTILAVLSVSIFSLVGCAADAEPSGTNTQNQNPPNEALIEQATPTPYDWQSEAAKSARRVGPDPLLDEAVAAPSVRYVDTETEDIVKGFGKKPNGLFDQKLTR
ncbi:MAG: hypothetical protein JST00_11740 [Deltaproteobacteria bacterium]|nr:hypothetical protein [Deltaproteobacteria bacterium]